MGDFDVPVFKTFWETYKKEFIKSNLLGLIFVILGYFLYVDVHLIGNSGGIINLFYYPTLLICLAYILTLCYVFPTFVHYDLKVYQILRTSFVMMLINPISTALMAIGSVAIYFLMTTVPGLIPLFSGSVLTVVLMWASFLAFSKIERRQAAVSK